MAESLRGQDSPPPMQILQGTPASPGIVAGEVYVMTHYETRILRRYVREEDVEPEVQRFEAAVREEMAAVEQASREMAASLGPLSRAIFEVHAFLLNDPALKKRVVELVRASRYTAEFAVDTALRDYIGKLERSAEAYFAERIPDLEALGRRLLTRLQGTTESRSLRELEQPVILIAHDLSPLVTATLDRKLVLGFATDTGGRTSHAAIVARDFGIPAVVGLKTASHLVTGGSEVILDGYAGRLVVHPDAATKARYQRIQEQLRGYARIVDAERHLPAETRDGVRIEVHGNIEFPEEVQDVVAAGGAGVGLYRTEFLYLRLGRAPSERDHLVAYRKALDLLGDRPLVIRTLDLGMDKVAPDILLPVRERNPFLGCRSIRLCQLRPEIFKTQLRAILRISADADVRCMLPLITNVDEVRWARQMIAETQRELAQESLRFNPRLPLGIMIEIPAAALSADSLATASDFFSIGTNDLIQYTLAVDRANVSVAGLFQPSHPAILRLIETVLRAAGPRGIPVSMCGEMAGEPLYVLLLLGLGLRSFSVAPSLIPEVKQLVRLAPLSDLEPLARHVLTLTDPTAINEHLRAETNRLLRAAGGTALAEGPPVSAGNGAGTPPILRGVDLPALLPFSERRGGGSGPGRPSPPGPAPEGPPA